MNSTNFFISRFWLPCKILEQNKQEKKKLPESNKTCEYIVFWVLLKKIISIKAFWQDSFGIKWANVLNNEFDWKFEICRLLTSICMVWPNKIFINYQIYLSFTYWQISFDSGLVHIYLKKVWFHLKHSGTFCSSMFQT